MVKVNDKKLHTEVIAYIARSAGGYLDDSDGSIGDVIAKGSRSSLSVVSMMFPDLPEDDSKYLEGYFQAYVDTNFFTSDKYCEYVIMHVYGSPTCFYFERKDRNYYALRTVGGEYED